MPIDIVILTIALHAEYHRHLKTHSLTTPEPDDSLVGDLVLNKASLGCKDRFIGVVFNGVPTNETYGELLESCCSVFERHGLTPTFTLNELKSRFIAFGTVPFTITDDEISITSTE